MRSILFNKNYDKFDTCLCFEKGGITVFITKNNVGKFEQNVYYDMSNIPMMCATADEHYLPYSTVASRDLAYDINTGDEEKVRVGFIGVVIKSSHGQTGGFINDSLVVER